MRNQLRDRIGTFGCAESFQGKQGQKYFPYHVQRKKITYGLEVGSENAEAGNKGYAKEHYYKWLCDNFPETPLAEKNERPANAQHGQPGIIQPAERILYLGGYFLRVRVMNEKFMDKIGEMLQRHEPEERIRNKETDPGAQEKWQHYFSAVAMQQQ